MSCKAYKLFAERSFLGRQGVYKNHPYYSKTMKLAVKAINSHLSPYYVLVLNH